MSSVLGWLGRMFGPEAEGSIEGLVVALATLAILLLLAFYAISRIRANSTKQEPSAADFLSKFREMHSQGALTDAEYRTIKSKLSPQVKAELTDNHKNG